MLTGLMTEHERNLAEAIPAVAAIVALAVESFDEPLRAELRSRISMFLERWADENPDTRPPVQKLVRRVVEDCLLRP